MNNPIRYSDSSGHFPCEGAHDCKESSKSNKLSSGSLNDEIDGGLALTELTGIDVGPLGYLGPIGTIGEGLSSNDSIVQGLNIGSGIFEAGGLTIKMFGGDVPPGFTSMSSGGINQTFGGGLIVVSAIGEYTAMNRQLDLLRAEGVNPAEITRMEYEAQISIGFKLGEASRATLPASLIFQGADAVSPNVIGGNPPSRTYAEILTVSDFHADPSTRGVVEDAIRNEPILNDISDPLRNLCNAVGGRC
jgi:hypothetical protein